MSEQQKKELENAMNLQAEAQAAEAHGQQMAMEKAGEMTQEIAQDVAEGTKKIYQSIEKGVVDGYKAIENGVVSGYKATISYDEITLQRVGTCLSAVRSGLRSCNRLLPQQFGTSLADDENAPVRLSFIWASENIAANIRNRQ